MKQVAPVIALRVPLRLAVWTFDSIETAPFDVRDYSRLKFGSDRAANMFGYQMADEFYARHHEILTTRRCVVVPAPSTTVPVAATLLAKHFRNRLNALLTREGHDTVEWTRIERNMSYTTEYCDMPKEERAKLIAADRLYVNRDFVQDKFLIFIDDCTITGTHENKIDSFLAEEDLLGNGHAFVCFAKYVGDDPRIELRLNFSEIKSARDLVTLSSEAGHVVTTRALRLLFETNENDFADLLQYAPEGFIEEAYHAAMAKNYHIVPAYHTNFNRVALRLGMARSKSVEAVT